MASLITVSVSGLTSDGYRYGFQGVNGGSAYYTTLSGGGSQQFVTNGGFTLDTQIFSGGL